MTTPQLDVLVVGAGPTGLTAALLLGRAGVRTHVVARHPGTSRHPKAHVVNARTMELFRQWGLSGAVGEAALAPERGLGMGWMTRMAGRELGRIMVDDDPAALEAMLTHSSEILRSCPQDVLEPLLLRAAEAHPGVTVEFATEVLSAEQDAEGVTTRARASRDGAERTFRSAYVIAADGSHSTIRSGLGIPAPRLQASGHMIGVHFTADLAACQRDRPFLLWWIVNPDTQGVFITLDGRHRWVYLFGYDPSRDVARDFTPERCARIVRHAVGTRDAAVDVLGVFPWRMETAIAERFREGRVFLAGDAAHRFPPTGGFGMNTGIQDAHNLAWKLGHVLKGTAGEALLDTYETERRPVAMANAEQSVANAERMAPTGALLADPSSLLEVENERSPEGAALRARISAAIPAQREQAFFTGQTFGFAYDSAAIVPDGTSAPESTVSVYRPTACPGARAPHLWLRNSADELVALHDAIGDRFAVLTGPRGRAWENAAAEAGRRWGLDIGVLRIGPGGAWRDEAGQWQELYGVGPSGCVLVRPDGHVAMRCVTDPGDALGALTRALSRVLAQERSPVAVG
ncbi:FAD-dependent monooxygenase [Streptomyces sp. UNOB3_S3]|uniref:FAD-dependent monooxygenase n=1 Tax=Streptomyces sp. UNOB3_S3 TaxID=2871682 RepID=UPI001E4F60F0|nr:FAD-dependent monooxygenase [Streptomyces sp. UNOB3_S3]MCC3776103.1 FAD-dependent monooxygenase [Streptomyces sp. UNOB3_S3]